MAFHWVGDACEPRGRHTPSIVAEDLSRSFVGKLCYFRVAHTLQEFLDSITALMPVLETGLCHRKAWLGSHRGGEADFVEPVVLFSIGKVLVHA